jgi:uncharacterized cupin superfamily protein
MTEVPPRLLSIAPVAGAGEPVAADRLSAGQPLAKVRNDYAAADGHFDAGIWESTPGRWRVNYTEHEVCVLLAGQVRLIAASGATVEFRAGDTFVVPAGFVGEWETLEAARKIYIIYTP